MSLDLGTISGTVTLDAAPFDKTLDKTTDKLKKWSGTQATEAKKGGEEQGAALSTGFTKKALVLLATGGLAVGAAFAATVVKGMNLEPATDKVAATLGLTVVEADKMSKAAGSVYSSNWGESMEDAAQRTGIVMSSITELRGGTAEEIAKMTGLFSAFSDGFEIDMGRATQVVGQMVKSGLVDNTQEGLDLLTVSLQKVPVNVREDILDAVDEYGPFMKTLGISGSEAMNLLVTASEKGMYGIDKTGDALKEFTIRTTDMSTTSKVGYDILGLSQEKMSKALLKGGDEGAAAFDKIVQGLLGIKDPVKQSQAALALFGTPLEDLSTAEIPAFLKGLTNTQTGLGDTAGAAQKMSDTMGTSASANISTFLRTLETGAVETIGGKVLPVLDDLTKKLDVKAALANLDGFTKWLQDNQTWLGPVAFGIGALGAALGGLALIGYISSIGGLTGAFGLLTGSIASSTAVTVAKRAADLIAAGATGVVTAAQWLWNAALSANPIGLVVLAIGLLVAAFVVAYQNSEEFRNVVNEMLREVQVVAQAIGAWFTGPFVDFFKNAAKWIGAQFDGIGKWFAGVGDGLMDAGRRVGDFFTKDVPAFFGNAAKGIGDAFSGVKDFILAPIRDAGKWINDNFVGGINGFLGTIGISWRVPTIPGFAEGGYTGAGGKYTPAGVVHAGEVVWSQEDVAAHGGPQKVDRMRRRRTPRGFKGDGYAGGGIVGNFDGYDPGALASMKAWAIATGSSWTQTGAGGARTYAQQAALYQQYLAGGNLAADPSKGLGPHMVPAIAMDLAPRPGENAHAASLLSQFGLGLTVPGEPWHIQALAGRGGGSTGIGDWVKGAIDGLLKNMPGVTPPWGDVLSTVMGKVSGGVANKVMSLFGMGDSATYDDGGWLPPGQSIVNNKTGRPEPVLTSGQWDSVSKGGASADEIANAIAKKFDRAGLRIVGMVDKVSDVLAAEIMLGYEGA